MKTLLDRLFKREVRYVVFLACFSIPILLSGCSRGMEGIDGERHTFSFNSDNCYYFISTENANAVVCKSNNTARSSFKKVIKDINSGSSKILSVSELFKMIDKNVKD